MIIAAIGMCLATMVGPLDETPVVRISRPGGGGPEFVRQFAVGGRESGGGVVVPSSAVGGGGGMTVVGAAAESSGGSAYLDRPQGLYTEQLLRGFGYDRSNYGFTVIDYPGWGGRRWNGGGGGWHGHNRPKPIDPRIISSLRDLAPIESKFPPVPGR